MPNEEVMHMGIGITMVRRAAVLVVFATALAACAKSSAGASGATSSHAPVTPASTMSIRTDKVTGLGTVLATSSGLTLYRNTRESNGVIACTGPCVQTWPPVTVSGTVPASPAGVATFGTVTRPDGTTQLTFKGMPLYTFAGDTTAGQAGGQGLHQDGVWFAVGPKGAITMSAGSNTSSGSSSGAGGTGW
jgi:predicted lipoprotein with Yx(FWY)xxD motif